MPCEGGPCSSEKDMKTKFDRVTRLLCEICIQYESDDDFASLSNDLRSWWKQHQKEDAERIKAKNLQKEKELIRKRALLKLTKQERLALGIR